MTTGEKSVLEDEEKIKMSAAWKERRKKRPVWRAPMIYAIDLWEPVMDAFLDIYEQQRRERCDNLCVYGETDSGKTTCFNILVESFIDEMNLRENVDIVKIKVAVNMTAAGLYKHILHSLNWVYKPNDKIADLELRIAKSFAEKRVKLIIVDEIDNLMNNKNRTDTEQFLQALRNINSLTKTPIIVLGIKRAIKLLKSDSQTNNRYKKLAFPKFELGEGNWKIFTDIIGTLDKKLLNDLNITSEFSKKPRIVEKLYELTTGKMGSFIKIYEAAVVEALAAGDNQLQLNHIESGVEYLKNSDLLSDDEREDVVKYETESNGNRRVIGKKYPPKWYFSCPRCGTQLDNQENYAQHINSH
ncbi:MAG: TniB family NTP-binding protein [Candidatus Hodarchaeales archaeon]|jgi:hypothetical protein